MFVSLSIYCIITPCFVKKITDKSNTFSFRFVGTLLCVSHGNDSRRAVQNGNMKFATCISFYIVFFQCLQMLLNFEAASVSLLCVYMNTNLAIFLAADYKKTKLISVWHHVSFLSIKRVHFRRRSTLHETISFPHKLRFCASSFI